MRKHVSPNGDTPRMQGIAQLLRTAEWNARVEATAEDLERMAASADVLSTRVAAGERVYGVTQGFGPLVAYGAAPDSVDQGMGLISHLGTGQGQPLSPDVTRLMILLRLEGMKRGYSAVSPELWSALAELWNRGFTPVVPREGSVSASGDLAPLAHAALALAGQGEAWLHVQGNGRHAVPAADALAALGADPVVWGAREALAFVNGTTASLALTCRNLASVRSMARSAAMLTGRIALLVGASEEAYSEQISRARGQRGQATAAQWIRAEMADHARNPERPLQEPYSLRCAPQVIGAVLDQLEVQERLLLREAEGCTDNPIVADGRVFHGGNFHAIPVGLVSDQLALCVHQLAFLAERQLALLVDPVANGGKPPMLTPHPGRASGLAGVQLSASSFVARIRQAAAPATLTAMPTNGHNQDIVPMSLNGANAVADQTELARLVIGSLALAVNQWTYLDEATAPPGTVWEELRRRVPALDMDRPLAEEVRACAALIDEAASRQPDGTAAGETAPAPAIEP